MMSAVHGGQQGRGIMLILLLCVFQAAGVVADVSFANVAKRDHFLRRHQLRDGRSVSTNRDHHVVAGNTNANSTTSSRGATARTTAEDAQKWAALKKASEALGAENSRRPHFPGMSVSVWGNQDPGDDSMLSRNPYAAQPPFPFLDDMQPVAPYDRVDKPTEGGLLGSAPETPGNSPRAVFPMLANDFVPEYNHPKDFPWDDDTEEVEGPFRPLNERDGPSVVAKADRVRPFGHFETRAKVNYPNVAPADR